MKVLSQLPFVIRQIKRCLVFVVPAIGDIAIMLWMGTELWDTTSIWKGRALLLGISFLGWEALHKVTTSKRFKPYSKRIWWPVVVFAVCFWIYGENIVKTNRSGPPLELCLYAEDEHGEPLSLTNEYLKLPMDGLRVLLINDFFKGFVMVPVLEGATNAAIRFGLPHSKSVVEHIGVKILCPTNVHFTFDSNVWVKQLDDTPGHWSVAYEAPMISPLMGRIIKPLTFDDIRSATLKANSLNTDIR